jgi:hypothetical protein
VSLDQSRLKGLVNTRAGAMADIGWDPEWEVNPKELKLIERIGGCAGGGWGRLRDQAAPRARAFGVWRSTQRS